ncbi:hypothetical protein KCP76_05020 [Salmonella enterica subsp. enterica serovar Weltevreden]|nr:hypothetical protein KCP76_05020 [Salmonella enterica subsp. enterica serovar Weltevreden]
MPPWKEFESGDNIDVAQDTLLDTRSAFQLAEIVCNDDQSRLRAAAASSGHKVGGAACGPGPIPVATGMYRQPEGEYLALTIRQKRLREYKFAMVMCAFYHHRRSYCSTCNKLWRFSRIATAFR